MDSDRDKSQYNVGVKEVEECCEAVLLAPHPQSQSKYTAVSTAQALLSIDPASTTEEENNVQSGPDPQQQEPLKLQWTLLSHLQKREINCCGTVRLNRRCMPDDLRCRTVKLRQMDIQVRTKGDLTATQWINKKEICMLTFMFHHKEISQLTGKHDKTDHCGNYNLRIGYVDKADSMANSYSISHQRWKWTKKDVFPSVQSGHSEQLQHFLHVVGRKFHTKTLTCLSDKHADTGWTRMAATDTCRETKHGFCKHQQPRRQFQLAMAWSIQAEALSSMLCM